MIQFIRENDELILIYEPELIDVAHILKRLEDGEEWHIHRCFFLKKKHLRKSELDKEKIYFCVGVLQGEYTKIDKEVFRVEHNFYFHRKINLNKRHFIAYRNISILSKIDELLGEDLYVGGDRIGCVSIDVLEMLIKKFPKTTELNLYARARISTILKEFWPDMEVNEVKFNQFLECRDKSLSSSVSKTNQTFFINHTKTELLQFKNVREELGNLLNREESVSERVWQEKICGILRIIYPKYIAAIREVKIRDVDKNDKRPDFILVDANGYIDVLEIKKPSTRLITKESSYRNNYVPVRDLAGSVQQIEKYIYCLNFWGKDGEKTLKKQLSDKLPELVLPKIVNPQGILLIGMSKEFNLKQKTDFEIIKRQYKHIAEIMTYDNLLQRIDNIINALELSSSGN